MIGYYVSLTFFCENTEVRQAEVQDEQPGFSLGCVRLGKTVACRLLADV